MQTFLYKNRFNILFILLLVVIVYGCSKTDIINQNSINKHYEGFIQLKKKHSKPIKYKICSPNKLVSALKNVLDKHGAINVIESNNPGDSDDWDLYLPCGYNYVETELKTVKISNPRQKLFGIRGCDKIASKNELWKIVSTYYGREVASKLMPETFIINNPDDIKLFKRRFNTSTKSNNRDLYFLKKNIQRKEGILLTRDYDTILKHVANTRRNIYRYNSANNKDITNTTNTTNTKNITSSQKEIIQEESASKHQKMSSLPMDFKIIQKAITNLYLVKNRKINLRLYVLIKCQNQVKQMYLYNKGKCIYTQKEVASSNTNTMDKEQHLTSHNLDPSIYKTYPETLEDLYYHMKQNDDSYKLLFKNIKKMFKDVFKAVQGQICNSRRLNDNMTFQLFGADVIFNKELHPFLLELNKGPSMRFVTDTDKEMKLQLLEDVLYNVGVLTQSRPIKINNFNIGVGRVNNNSNFIKIL